VDQLQIVYHIGANCTDGDRLLRSMMRNVDGLRSHGVIVPGPGRYRKLLRETILSLDDAVPTPDARDVLLDAIIDEQDATRLVLSNSTFLCQPSRIFERGLFYGIARSKVSALRSLFPDDKIEIFLALRNPATFVPAVWDQVKGMDFRSFLGGTDPRAIRWSDLVTRIRTTVPDVPLTVWCNEDTTLIWGDLLRLLAGVGPEHAMEGTHDLLATVMSPEGLQRFLNYMETHPGQNEAQVRRVIGAFLDKYAIPEAIEEEVDLPGWDAAMVDEMTRDYEADVARIAAMPGIRFVAP
jgi:hypothetical protein